MKRTIIWIILTSFLSLAFLFACGDQKEAEKPETDVTYKDVKKEAKEVMETAKDYTMEKKEEYVRHMNAKLAEFDKKIQTLQAMAESKAAQLKEESKAQFNQSMEALAKKKEAAAEKLNELESASDKAWTDIKAGADSAMDELNEALNRASSHFGS